MLIDRFDIAKYKRGFRMQAEVFDSARDRTGVIKVVRVEPPDDLTRSLGKPLVDAICLAFVFFGEPTCQPRCILLDDLNAVVR